MISIHFKKFRYLRLPAMSIVGRVILRARYRVNGLLKIFLHAVHLKYIIIEFVKTLTRQP